MGEQYVVLAERGSGPERVELEPGTFIAVLSSWVFVNRILPEILLTRKNWDRKGGGLEQSRVARMPRRFLANPNFSFGGDCWARSSPAETRRQYW